MVRLSVSVLLLGALLLCAVEAQVTCKSTVGGSSSLYGTAGSTRKSIDWTDQLPNGPITTAAFFSNKTCVLGVRATFGSKPVLAGTDMGLTTSSFSLPSTEWVVKAEVKANKCVEWVRLTTNKGKTLVAGNSGSTLTTLTTRPAASNGRLLTLKATTDVPAKATVKPNLRQLQFVWGTVNCSTAAAPKSSPNPASKPATAPAPKASPAPVSKTSPAPASKTSPSPASKPATAPAPKASPSPAVKKSPSPSPKPAPAPVPKPSPAPAGVVTCPANTNMCSEKATNLDFNYCPFLDPWTRSRCVGGCCISTGKCASSSCSISGMGSDVSSFICYGINNGVSIGGSNMCVGLGCRLAQPGCTTDTFGGNCVGTVRATGTLDQVDPKARKWLGYPCLDQVPSTNTLSAAGKIVTTTDGVYVSGLWGICNCTDIPEAGSLRAQASLPSVKQIADVLKPNATVLDLLTVLAPAVNQLGSALANSTASAPDFSTLIPTLNLSQIIQVPDTPPVVIPSYNITIPIDLFPNISSMDPGKFLSSLTTGDNGAGLADLLRGLAGGNPASTLTSFADYLDAVRSGKDSAKAFQQFATSLPQTLVTPTGFSEWLVTLLPNNANGTNPLQPVADAVQALGTFNTSSGTNTTIADALKALSGVLGQLNTNGTAGGTALSGLLSSALDQVAAGAAKFSPTEWLKRAATEFIAANTPAEGNSTNPLAALLGQLAAAPPPADSASNNSSSGLADLLSKLAAGAPSPAGNSSPSLADLLSKLAAGAPSTAGNSSPSPGPSLADILKGLAAAAPPPAADSTGSPPADPLAAILGALAKQSSTSNKISTGSTGQQNPLAGLLQLLASGAPPSSSPPV